MTRETMRCLIQSPHLLTSLTLEDFVRMSPRDIKDLPEPKILMSQAVCGTPIAIVFPLDDYTELYNFYLRINEAVDRLTVAVAGSVALTDEQADTLCATRQSILNLPSGALR